MYTYSVFCSVNIIKPLLASVCWISLLKQCVTTYNVVTWVFTLFLLYLWNFLFIFVFNHIACFCTKLFFFKFYLFCIFAKYNIVMADPSNNVCDYQKPTIRFKKTWKKGIQILNTLFLKMTTSCSISETKWEQTFLFIQIVSNWCHKL